MAVVVAAAAAGLIQKEGGDEIAEHQEQAFV
jgi:hypothetical protein